MKIKGFDDLIIRLDDDFLPFFFEIDDAAKDVPGTSKTPDRNRAYFLLKSK